MGGEWSDSLLGDLIEINHGFAFGGGFFHDEPQGDVLLTPGNFAIGGGFKADKFKYYDGPVPDEFVLREGDLLVTMTDLSKDADTLGYPASVPSRDDGRRYLHNQRLGKIVIKDQALLDFRYLYYLMCGQDYRHEVLASATGTTVKHTSPERIKRFCFVRPPLSEQRAIARILGALDDKIELNRRMNETMEAMARALFMSWFVDFDPVRAKAENRDPGLPKHIADVFPDRFEDSKLGEVPAGWEVGTLADFAELNPETWSKSTAPDEIEYVDLANTKRGKIEETQRYLWKDAPSRAQRILRPGDTIVGTVRPGNGSFTIVAQEGLTGSTGFAVLRPRRAIYEEYLYLAATSSDNIERLTHLADGAAYPAVRPDVVLATQVVLPEKSLLESFARMTKPMMAKIAANERESRTLAAMRDTLLPKLISGEVQVAGHEQFLEAMP